MSDCPLAPHKELRQGQPSGCIVTVPYTAPCKDWDGVNCNWFEPAIAIREMVNFIEEKDIVNTSMPDISKLRGIAPTRRSKIRRGRNG